MDEETLSNYGWVVIVVIIICILLGMATPFGNFIADATMDSLDALRLKLYDSVGIELPIEDTPQYFIVEGDGVLNIAPKYRKTEGYDEIANLAEINNVSIEDALRSIVINNSTEEYTAISQEDFEQFCDSQSLAAVDYNLGIDSSEITADHTRVDYLYEYITDTTLGSGEHATVDMINAECKDLVNANEDVISIREQYALSGKTADKYLSDLGLPYDEAEYAMYARIILEPNNLGFREFFFINSDSKLCGDSYLSIINGTASLDDKFAALEHGGTWTEFVEKYTAYEALPAKLGIPSKIDGEEVKSIPMKLFNPYLTVKVVQVPDSVKTVGYCAFAENTSIEKVILKDGVEAIDEYAFYDCAIKNVSIPDTVKSIGNHAFDLDANLSNINLSGITSIGESAFSDCTSLQSIVIPSCITYIGTYAFSKSGVSSVIFETRTSQTTTDWGIFENCSNLKKVIINPSSAAINLLGAFNGCDSLSNIVIGDGVKTIGSNTFANCSSLIDLTFPSSLENFGKGVINNCASLQSISFADNTHFYEFPANVFNMYSGNIGVKRISFGNNCSFVNGILENSFEYSKNLETVSFGDNCIINSIGDNAFYDCTNLNSVTFGANCIINSIGKSVFSKCSKLTNFIVPNGVESIGTTAFSGCSELRSISLPDSLVYIGSGNYETYGYTGSVFSDCTSLTSITIPKTVIGIDSYAFNGCTKLESVIFEANSSLTKLGASAFKNCTSLKQIYLPEGLAVIPEYLFVGCSNLNQIVLPSTTTSINSYAFKDCSLLENLTIPKNVTTIQPQILNYSGIKNIVFEDGCKITKLEGLTFARCDNLTSIVLPANVTVLDAFCVSNCPNFEAITLTGMVTNINSKAFEGIPIKTIYSIPNDYVKNYASGKNLSYVEI